ncbi:MAG: hypothetical protein RL030_1346 [Pseudomonadota bacterium]|jgi:hypothetical protein
MNIKRTCALVVLAAALLGGCDDDGTGIGTPPPLPPTPPSGSNAVVLEWNRILAQNQGTGNLFSFRQYAILHIAMFDAVNSVKQTYKPYRLLVPNGTYASDEAAAAQAARDVMVSLYPAATASFDTALSTRLATLPQPAASQGVDIGKLVAAAVLQWRTNDGSAGPDPAYLPPALPGLWQPTAPGQVALGTRYAFTLPFAMLTPTQFLPAPPPALNSVAYAQNFQQVYDIGRVDSVVRTADQTQLARAVAGVNYSPGPSLLWNSVARTIVEGRQISLLETARLFALMNVSMHDSIQTSHTSKFVYQLWRPVTAIANAGNDANDATSPDATWAPLLTTPPYPSHSSNVTCLSTGAARALAKALGTDLVTFDMTWTWTGAAGAGANYTRRYTSIAQLANDAGMSRVYGGIHFEFEVQESVVACTKVADYVFANYMTLR